MNVEFGKAEGLNFRAGPQDGEKPYLKRRGGDVNFLGAVAELPDGDLMIRVFRFLGPALCIAGGLCSLFAAPSTVWDVAGKVMGLVGDAVIFACDLAEDEDTDWPSVPPHHAKAWPPRARHKRGA